MLRKAESRGQLFKDQFSIPRKVTIYVTRQITHQRTRQITRNISR